MKLHGTFTGYHQYLFGQGLETKGFQQQVFQQTHLSLLL